MLPEYFQIDSSNAKSKQQAIFAGKKYRITILSEVLIRLEYNEKGEFVDRPTEFALNRNFEIPQMDVKEDANYLQIKTNYFYLQYHKEHFFGGTKMAPDGNLRISLNGTEKVWYYNHPEVRNFKGSTVSLDDLSKIKMENGLYSVDGFASIDDSKSLVVESDGFLNLKQNPGIDIYLFIYRRDFGLCLRDFFKLTGNPALIPRYALGIWWFKNEKYNDEDIISLVNKFNKENIPLSILLLGNYWHDQKLVNKKLVKSGFTFNNQLIVNPQNTIKYLHDRGIRIGLNINPIDGILPTEKYYDALKSDLNLEKNIIIPLNVFDKNFINGYFKDLIDPLTNLGVDFYWIDYLDKSNPYNLRLLNHYHFLYSNKSREKRGLILSRNGLVASHRYPVLYSGETVVSWETLKFLPSFNSQSANIGLSWWSHDIGGYKFGTEDEELYRRYVQLGTFSPIFRFASSEGRYYKREPWKWELKTLKIVSDYCQLRHRLIPYLYSEAYKYTNSGSPLILPLYYTYPKIYDEPIYKNEYYFGSELFISPITTKKDQIMKRSVEHIFLPDGMWYDFKNGKKYPGGKRYVCFYKDEDYPVFARCGAIIPMAKLEQNKNVTSAPLNMEINIFPGKSNKYILYEDDGVSNLYKSGYYIKTEIFYDYQEDGFSLIIRPIDGKSGIISDLRNYKLKFRNNGMVDNIDVLIGDERITNYKAYIDDNDFIVEIPNVYTTKQLSIVCKSKNLDITSSRLVNEDIESIISDAKIKTELKTLLAEIFFSDDDNRKKRIKIRHLKSRGLDKQFIKMFLKLIEYIDEIEQS